MARSRIDLQAILEGITDNVYFQPPPNMSLQYPCVIYKLSDVDQWFSSNSPYHQTKRYEITVIDRNPDSLIPQQILNLPLSSYDRRFTTDGLNHDVLTLYF